MKDSIISAVVATLLIGSVLIAFSSCSATKKVEQKPAPMKRVAVPYWG